MNFATWSIRNPIPSILLFILLSLAGIWGFNQLRVQNLPDVDMPTVDVSLTLPGAAPAQLETEVARRVEDALSSVTGVKHLRTSITDGSVAISVEFLLEKNLSDALVETKDARSEEHTSELQSLMRISYAVFCLTKKKKKNTTHSNDTSTT